MPSEPSPRTVPTLIPALMDALRADLARVGDVAEVLGPWGADALAREQRVPGLLAARRAGADPAAVVARLFPLGDTVAERDVDAALPAVRGDGLARLGLAERDGDEMRATCDLSWVESEGGPLWFASDVGERVTGRAVRADHVLGVGGASLTLAGITDRTPVGRALDLGTGCGIQAALLAGHADEVVATDLSTRALAYARFNAALNSQVWELREGSMFAPVAGERVDLVVSNPPFVITPDAAYRAGLPHMEYRDAGLSADRLLADLLGQIGGHLTETGRAQVLANWEHRAGEPWDERLAAILTDDVDAWVIERERLDPAEYVEMWLRDGGFASDADGRARADAVYEAWLADFAARGVEAVGFGYVLLAARTGRGNSVGTESAVSDLRAAAGAEQMASSHPSTPVRRFETVTGAATQPLGAHLRGSFDAIRRGPVQPDWRIVAADDVTVEHHFRPGADEPEVMLLRQGGGFGRAMQLDTALAGLVSVADGSLTLGQTVAALADLLDAPAAELWSSLARDVGEFLAGGFVHVTDDCVRLSDS